MSMLGYKLVRRNLVSIWYSYPYKYRTIHEEVGKPIVAEHGFHFYKSKEDIPDVDFYYNSGEYLLARVEALGDITSKPQVLKSPAGKVVRLYATNKIRILFISELNVGALQASYYWDELIPKNFLCPDYVQESEDYMEEYYGLYHDVMYRESSEEAPDGRSLSRKRRYPGVYFFDADTIHEGAEKDPYYIYLLGLDDEVDEESAFLENKIRFKGVTLDAYIPGSNEPILIYDSSILPFDGSHMDGKYTYNISDGEKGGTRTYYITQGLMNLEDNLLTINFTDNGIVNIVFDNISIDNRVNDVNTFFITFGENITQANVYFYGKCKIKVSGTFDNMFRSLGSNTILSLYGSDEMDFIPEYITVMDDYEDFSHDTIYLNYESDESAIHFVDKPINPDDIKDDVDDNPTEIDTTEPITITDSAGKQVFSKHITTGVDYYEYTINKSSIYTITGGTLSQPITKNIIINFKNITNANVILDNLFIDNSGLNADVNDDLVGILNFDSSVTNTTITIKNIVYLEGKNQPYLITCFRDLTLLGTGQLKMYGPTDKTILCGGIYTTGACHVKTTGGSIVMDMTRDCFSTNNITIEGSSVLELASYNLSAIHARGGSIIVNGSCTVNVYYAGAAGYDAADSIIINAGYHKIRNCYSNGMYATSKININGGTVDIITLSEYQYIDMHNMLNYNNLSMVPGDNIIRRINKNPGSHHGLAAGEVGCVIHYNGQFATNTINPAGEIKVSGGIVKIDTTATGLRYNVGTSLIYKEIGTPGDGLYSGDSILINGGTFHLRTAGTGIHSENTMKIIGVPTININYSGYGIETCDLTIGVSNSKTGPKINIVSNMDSIYIQKYEVSYLLYTYETDTITESQEDIDNPVFSQTITVTNYQSYIPSENYTKYMYAIRDGARFMMYSGTVITTLNPETITAVVQTSLSNYSRTTASVDGTSVYINGSVYFYGGVYIGHSSSLSDTKSSVINNIGSFYIGNIMEIYLFSSVQIPSPTTVVVPVINTTAALVKHNKFSILTDTLSQLISYKVERPATYVFYASNKMKHNGKYTLMKDSTTIGTVLAK